MADRWANAKGDYVFRFFSPEQIDRILSEGVKRGRNGSHEAIERILRHEPGLVRADLWRQIRRLKQPAVGKPRRRTNWSPEDDQILRRGYEAGWKGKREAVRELLMRHPHWQPHLIWGRAAKLGLVQAVRIRDRLRSRQPWSEDDDRILLTMAGYKSAKYIAKVLHRSENAVRYRLAILGKSSRVHLEGYARRALARDLHLGSHTIQRLIVKGLLAVRDPRITRKSLRDACTTGRLPGALHSEPCKIEDTSMPPCEETSETTSSNNIESMPPSGALQPPRSSRAKLIWEEVASQLSVDASVIEQLIFQGVLKLHDPRITEESLTKFCARHGALVKTDFLDAETRTWLAEAMNLASSADEEAAHQLEPFRKHALVVRMCEHCGRAVRGNVYFRHQKTCRQRDHGSGFGRGR